MIRLIRPICLSCLVCLLAAGCVARSAGVVQLRDVTLGAGASITIHAPDNAAAADKAVDMPIDATVPLGGL